MCHSVGAQHSAAVPLQDAAPLCGVAELANFAVTLRHDLKAMKADLKLQWSNGVVDGHVNRLKFIKRQMFGRAKFDLLRVHVLAQV